MKTTSFPAALLACTLLGAMPVAMLPIRQAHAQATGSYTVTRITFQGNVQVPTDELTAALPIQVGQTIDQDGLQANVAAIGQVYRKHNVGTDITQRLSTLHKKAMITYIMAEKAPVAPTVTHVGITADRVSVTGNDRIKTPAILAAANVKPGDALTNDKIKAAQDAISALYKKANIGSTVSTDWTNTAIPQHVDLVFKIVEKADE